MTGTIRPAWSLVRVGVVRTVTSSSAKSPPRQTDSAARAYPNDLLMLACTVLEILEGALAHGFVTTCYGSTCIYKLTGMITDGLSSVHLSCLNMALSLMLNGCWLPPQRWLHFSVR